MHSVSFFVYLSNDLQIALFSALIFGLMHAFGTGDPQSAEALSANTQLVVALCAVQGILKMIQAGLFGFCMAVIFMRTGNIWLPAITHAAFDLLYLGPQLLCNGQLPSTYLTGNLADIAVILLTIVLLFRPCAKSMVWLRDGVVTYTSFHEQR